jgi:hypothetical protein
MKINAKNCEIVKRVKAKNQRNLEIAEDYVKIYRNKRLSAKTSKSKMAYYRKQKKWENKIIKLKRYLRYDSRALEQCKRYGYP